MSHHNTHNANNNPIQYAELISYQSPEYRAHQRSICRQFQQHKALPSCPFDQSVKQHFRTLEYACNRWLNQLTIKNDAHVLRYIQSHQVHYQELDHVLVHPDQSVTLCELKIRQQARQGDASKAHRQLNLAQTRLQGWIAVRQKIAIVFDLAALLGNEVQLNANHCVDGAQIQQAFEPASARNDIADFYVDLQPLLPQFIAAGWLASDFIAELQSDLRFIEHSKLGYQTAPVAAHNPFMALAPLQAR